MDAKPETQKKNSKPQQKPQPSRKATNWNDDLRKVGDHLMVAGLTIRLVEGHLTRKKFLENDVLSGLYLGGTSIAVRDGRATSLRAFAEYEAAHEAVAALEKAAGISGADLSAAIATQQQKLAEALGRLAQAVNTPGAVDLYRHHMGENAYLLVSVGDPELDVDPVLSIQGEDVVMLTDDKWSVSTVRSPGDVVPAHTFYACDQAAEMKRLQFVGVCGRLKGQDISEKMTLLLSLRRGKYDAAGLLMQYVEVQNRGGYLAVMTDRTYMALPYDDTDLVETFLAGHVVPEKPAVPKSDAHLAAPTLGEAMAEKGITPEAYAEADPVATEGAPDDIPEALPAEPANTEADPAPADEGPTELDAAVEHGKKRVSARQAAAGVKPRTKKAATGGRSHKPGKPGNDDEE